MVKNMVGDFIEEMLRWAHGAGRWAHYVERASLFGAGIITHLGRHPTPHQMIRHHPMLLQQWARPWSRHSMTV